MKQVWEPEDLIVYWTLVEEDWRLLGNKSGATRLGFALMLKYVEIEGEFPCFGEQIPSAAVEFVAELVRVDSTELDKYSFDNRTAEYHRAQIRQALGLRPATEDDKQRWAVWLAAEQCPVEQDRGRLQAALRQRCRSEGVEPPWRRRSSGWSTRPCAGMRQRSRPRSWVGWGRECVRRCRPCWSPMGCWSR